MPEEIIRRKRRLSSFQIIILGFAGVILLGALLLMLPISTTGGNVTPFNETLFTATSAVCVTGLVVQDTGSYWSTFGQAVILALIQIGGLGVVTVAASFALLSGRRISLMQRSTMQDAISAPKVGGIVRLTRFILRGTFLIELLGALAVLPVFCRDYGWRGVWMAIFHSVSAFCNAGFDILGTESNRYPSLTGYADSPVINITIMLLIVIGGIRITAIPRENMAEICVSDNGLGIPDELKEHVFEMFFTGGNPIGDSRRSLGLGLTLCQAIIHGISLFFDQFLSLRWVSCAFRGIQVCVIYLILTAGLKMLKSIF